MRRLSSGSESERRKVKVIGELVIVVIVVIMEIFVAVLKVITKEEESRFRVENRSIQEAQNGRCLVSPRTSYLYT
jgi:hypothetical protein